MAINNYIKWPAERIRQDENNRLISDVQITTWNGKADSDHNHDDKYIPISGDVTKFNATIFPAEPGQGSIGIPTNPIHMICTDSFFVTEGGSKNFSIQITPSLGIIFRSSDNTNNYGYLRLNEISRSVNWDLPDDSGTLALTKDIPASLKNPNALSIQLNGGDANTYDGSAALSIDITPAAIGAAASGDLDNYIPLSGSTSINGNLAPSKNTFALGILSNPWATIFTRTFQLVDSNRVRFDIYPIGDFAQFKLYDSKSDYHITIDPEVLTGAMSANVHIQIPVKDGTLALLNDIPTTLPASDVKDWAKADSKPTYTFAEITEKPEKFTPDTHTHTISEVTDLQTTLDGKASKNHVHDSEKVTNWNNAVVSGTYYAAADATNNPSADAAYSGNVVKGSTIVTQTVVKESIDGDLYKYIRRGQLDTNRTTVTTWGQWQEIQYVVTE